MSLVGSLEDLGLGEILQIVGLSGKSGMLCVRSAEGEGRILFQNGTVRGAQLEGAPQDLRGLLASEKVLPGPDLDVLVVESRKRGRDLEALVLERGALDADALEGLRRRHVEGCLRRMFRWSVGDFTFQVREGDVPQGELVLTGGMSAQFVALECTRLNDEEDAGGGDDVFTAFEPVVPPAAPPETPAPIDVVVREEGGAEAVSVESGPRRPPSLADRPVVLVDPRLDVLEWARAALAAEHRRVHVFQRSEFGVGRIRQYLARGELPWVVLAVDAPPDVLSGTEDGIALARRLWAQAPNMPLLLLVQAGGVRPDELPPGACIVERPGPEALASADAVEREACAKALRQAVSGEGRACDGASLTPEEQRQLDAATDRLRGARVRGEAMREVLDFASQRFRRVAIFLVRDAEAVGLAQAGLPAAGGPDDRALREVCLPLENTPWLKDALERGLPLRSGPRGEGDRRLAAHLGEVVAPEAWVAPIRSRERVVALVYADNLPDAEPLPETHPIEALLREASQALERFPPEPTSCAATPMEARRPPA